MPSTISSLPVPRSKVTAPAMSAVKFRRSAPEPMSFVRPVRSSCPSVIESLPAAASNEAVMAPLEAISSLFADRSPLMSPPAVVSASASRLGDCDRRRAGFAVIVGGGHNSVSTLSRSASPGESKFGSSLKVMAPAVLIEKNSASSPDRVKVMVSFSASVADTVSTVPVSSSSKLCCRPFRKALVRCCSSG